MGIRDEMMSGRLYDASNGELLDELYKAQELCQDYNALRITDFEGRARILGQLIGKSGKNLIVVPPFFCDYGSNIEVGDDVFINCYCVFLDEAQITIGSGTVIAGGSVVVNDIPSGVLAAGTPCKVIRKITPEDRDRYR